MTMPPWGFPPEVNDEERVPKGPPLPEYRRTRGQVIPSPACVPDSTGITLLTDPPQRYEIHARYGVVVLPGGFTFGPRAASHLAKLMFRAAHEAQMQGGRGRRYTRVPDYLTDTS